jgi:hypothetical protein
MECHRYFINVSHQDEDALRKVTCTDGPRQLLLPDARVGVVWKTLAKEDP